MRHYPNTLMPDIPSPVVPVLGAHFLLRGDTFSPMELCFPELIGPPPPSLEASPKEPRPHTTAVNFESSFLTGRPLLSHTSALKL